MVAQELEVELSASWLSVPRGRLTVSPGLSQGLQGVVRTGSGPALVRALRGLDRAAARSGIVTDLATVASRCSRLRASGKRIVFTNGVFDLFHVGHLRLLRAARLLGDTLVVGVNSDESARRLKGRKRPIIPQFARTEIVAGVRGVAFCAIFDQEDPRELLRHVRPHVIAKGSEYARADVVGGALVRQWGGEVSLVPHLQGWSTTEVIRKLRGRRT
jgi:D-beta-D-heptose 7-phosphate kinase/D-beta-D-heptose 1-phosphate adenosyltransferase